MPKTKREVHWSGWNNNKPHTLKQRREMLKKCGSKCFLGKNFKFPICKKNTCKIDKRGLWAAFIRARQWKKRIPKYKKIYRKENY